MSAGGRGAGQSPVPDLAIVVSPRGWAQDLHRFVADHGGAKVRHRVLDAREATGADYQVLVVDDLTSFLSARLIEKVQSGGRRVLGLYDALEPTGERRLRELGVDEVATVSTPPEQLLAIAQTLASGLDLVAELGAFDAAEPIATSATRAPVLAVGGPAGGPGATELALALAVACARRGEDVVLLDGDDVAPSLAQRLGLPLHPNLRVAVDAARRADGGIQDASFEVAVPGGAIRVVTGLPTPGAWADVRPGEVIDLVIDLGADVDRVIVNVGHGVDQFGGGVLERGRHEQTQVLLAHADRVLVVAAPNPVGVARTLDWVATVREVARGPIDVVVNRAPSSTFAQGEIADEIRRSWSPDVLAFVHDEPAVADAAWRAEIVDGRRWRKAIARLADTVAADGPVALVAQPVAAPHDPLGAGL